MSIKDNNKREKFPTMTSVLCSEAVTKKRTEGKIDWLRSKIKRRLLDKKDSD